MDGALQVGVAVAERSYLSKKVTNNLVELQCVQFVKNELAVFETLENAQFYHKSQRHVRAVSENVTEVKYILEFDISIVKFALGFALPRCIVAFKVNSDMRKYLRQLKEVVERSE